MEESIGKVLLQICKAKSAQLSFDIDESLTPADAQRKLNQIKVDSLNESVGNLQGWNCPLCKNRGYIAVMRDDGDGYYTKDCKCMQTRKSIAKMEQSGLKDIIGSYTFEKFNVRSPWQNQARTRAEQFANDPKGMWFGLFGQSGAGKTHLCTAICRKMLLDGKQVAYMAWRNEIDKLKTYGNDERLSALDYYKRADVLYIDDLFKIGAAKNGVVMPTSADISIAYEIINQRYVNRDITIITSEFLPEELLEIDEAIGGRVIEMCGENSLSISRGIERNHRLNSIKGETNEQHENKQ